MEPSGSAQGAISGPGVESARTVSKATIAKVIAYITQGDRLLVLGHPLHPEAGIQVPAGTIEAGESPEDAALREAWEETCLDELVIRSFLSVQVYDLSPHGRAELQRRHFFHIEFCGQAPGTWRHYERVPSDGSPEPIEFFWVNLPNVPELSGGQGARLPFLALSLRQPPSAQAEC